MAAKQELQNQYEKKIQCLYTQLQDYHRQIEQVQGDLDGTRGRLSVSCREQEDLKRAVNQKDDTIITLESEVDKLRFDLKEKETSYQRQCGSLQDQVHSLSDQVQHKDSALVVCQNEVKCHLQNMEDVRENLLCDIKHKETLLSQMRENLQSVFDDLKCKTEDNSDLERSVLDIKARLAQSTSYCGELESKLSFLEEKIPQLESQFSKEKQQALLEMEEVEKKLSQAMNDVCCSTSENRKMMRFLQDKEEELQMLCTERDNLTRSLQREKEETQCLSERIEGLESDNQEICRLLQMKIKNLKDVEQTLCVREQELAHCRNCIEELNAKIRELHTGGDPMDDAEDYEKQLKLCQEALEKCEIERKDLEKKLQYAIREMDKLAKDVKRLKCELEEARNDNCDKEAMIIELEETLERAKHEMETRMCRIDQQLERYEKEIKDKTHMLAETGDKCCRFQEAVAEKNGQLEQLDNKLSRSLLEMEAYRCQAKEQEDAKICVQKAYNEERVRNAELCQESKRLRTQLTVSGTDACNLKKDLTNCQRESECRLKENNDLRHKLQDQDTQIKRLSDERACLSNKIVSIQCRLEEETNQMSMKLADTKNRQDCEVTRLRTHVCELEDSNSCLSQRLAAKERQIVQMEKTQYQKVDTLTRETSLLQGKLQDKESQLQATKDCLTIKDSEIMRLKLRMCSSDRCNSNQIQAACSQDLRGTNNIMCATMDGDCAGKRRAKSCDSRRSCSFR